MATTGAGGKQGGGGTIAKHLAEQGADVLDLGIGLILMHSPFELAHKRDIYDLYVGLRAFIDR
jgi:aspartyl aminopeptidase